MEPEICSLWEALITWLLCGWCRFCTIWLGYRDQGIPTCLSSPVVVFSSLRAYMWGGPHSNLCEEDIGRALSPFRCTHTETYRHTPKHVHFVVKLKLLWNVGHVLKCGQNAVISSTCCGRDGERGSRHRAEEGLVFVVELMPRDTHLDEPPSPQPWIWMSRALLFCVIVYV